MHPSCIKASVCVTRIRSLGISISHSSTHKCSLMRICSELIEWTYFILANNCMKQCHAICKQCCRQVPIESTGSMCAARIINQTCVPPHPPVLAICSASFDAIRQLKLPNCRSCPPCIPFIGGETRRQPCRQWNNQW